MEQDEMAAAAPNQAGVGGREGARGARCRSHQAVVAVAVDADTHAEGEVVAEKIHAMVGEKGDGACHCQGQDPERSRVVDLHIPQAVVEEEGEEVPLEEVAV